MSLSTNPIWILNISAKLSVFGIEIFSFENNLINSTEINIGDLIACLDLFYNLCSNNDITMIKETFSDNRKLIALMSK